MTLYKMKDPVSGRTLEQYRKAYWLANQLLAAAGPFRGQVAGRFAPLQRRKTRLWEALVKFFKHNPHLYNTPRNMGYCFESCLADLLHAP